MSTKYENILETIGRTPVVRLNKLAPEGINIYVKVESFNPMGSVKDRLALNIIEQAEKDGTLKPGQTVVEATSGNTGIGLAMVCAQKGYPLVVTMAESFSIVAAIALLLMGQDRMDRMIDWIMSKFTDNGMRVWSVLAFAFGGLLIYVTL